MAEALDNPEVLRATDLHANQIEGTKKFVLPETGHELKPEKPVKFKQTVQIF